MMPASDKSKTASGAGLAERLAGSADFVNHLAFKKSVLIPRRAGCPRDDEFRSNRLSGKEPHCRRKTMCNHARPAAWCGGE
ncbi:protein of unknown function [Agrobacterium pusense]|uniref:Uncharacterized protein n=1 Tax=Agrobacterium pusense TaxID=648995 RepID=U4QBB3_9HYPH|nr:protein of unknown function [Agrobacterium pusense]